VKSFVKLAEWKSYRSRGLYEFLYALSIYFFLIFVKSRIRDQNVMLIRICEFRENMQRKSRTFLRGVNGIIFKCLKCSLC